MVPIFDVKNEYLTASLTLYPLILFYLKTVACSISKIFIMWNSQALQTNFLDIVNGNVSGCSLLTELNASDNLPNAADGQISNLPSKLTHVQES